MVVIENKTFDEIALGQSAELQRTLTNDDIRLFGVLSGDANPTHFADIGDTAWQDRVTGHGMWGAALISALLGNDLPGAGTVYRKQNLDFLTPVALGDTLTVTITAVEKDPVQKTVTFDCKGVNQNGESVFTGIAVVLAPTEKRRREQEVGLYAQF
ncbi:MAG: MaoC/PaaZ C-terminal domain-containing protein [Rhodospirillaceae bacterium]|nr:MaoC/PaaZ C-terminal domain-containing protein [Rhodospirillaceae bacterium]MEA4839351.1 MaoC/PaaZ C-terminal domain-containing protein [Rhodospirillaceae bacterium]